MTITSPPVSRRGFTLVELLVAISLVVLVSAMLATAMSSSVQEARIRRAKGELLNYGQLIQSRVNTIAFGGLNLNESPKRVRESSRGSGLGTIRKGTGDRIPDPEVTSEDKSRMRTLARRDFARMVLPECQADLFYPPASLQYRTDLGGVDDGSFRPACAQIPPPPAWNQMRALLGLRTGEGINDYMKWTERNGKSPNRPPNLENPTSNPQVDAIDLFQTYEVFQKACTHREEYVDPDKLDPIKWTRQYESAECLYLILSTYAIDGGVARDHIPERSIGDLDEDGVPEVLDPWGIPVVFMRSPVGLQGRGFKNQSLAGTVDPDPFDFLATDFRYQVNNENEHPLYLTPVIVSAGQDQAFGIITPETIQDSFYSSSAITLANPPRPLWKGARFGSNSTKEMAYRYPDPFFNVLSGTLVIQPGDDPANPTFTSIGMAKSGGGMGFPIDTNEAADNITSIDSDI